MLSINCIRCTFGPGSIASRGLLFGAIWLLAESASRNCHSEWDAVSPWSPRRKLHPGIRAWNGTRFPFGMGFGKYVPEFGFRMGRAFRTSPQPETASWIRTSDRDPLSGALLRRCFASKVLLNRQP